MSRMIRDESVTPLDGTDRVAMAAVFASSNSDDSELEKFPMHPALIAKYQKNVMFTKNIVTGRSQIRTVLP